MSIAKFFVLAIVLPMTTVFFALMLKDNKTDSDNDILDKEKYMNIINLDQVDQGNSHDYPDMYKYDEDGNLNEHTKENAITNNEVMEAQEKIDQTKGSLEERIRLHKLELENLEKQKRDTDKRITKDPEINNEKINTAIIINQSPTTKKLTKTRPQNVKAKPKKRFVRKNKPITNRSKKTRTPRKIVKQKTRPVKKVVIIKKPVKLAVPNRSTTGNVSRTNSQFKKQTIIKQPSPEKKPGTSVTSTNQQYFGTIFEEDYEPDENDAAIETEPIVNNSIIPGDNETTVKKKFSTNPCSGRSARYIARCRKK